MKKIINTIIKSEWIPLAVFLIAPLAYNYFVNSDTKIAQTTFNFIVTSGLIYWLLQTTINLYLNKRFESYKVELQTKSQEYKLGLDKSLEEHKSILNLSNLKQGKLHDLRLNIISDLYQKLVVLNRNMLEITATIKLVSEDPEKEEGQRLSNTADSFNDFVKFYQERKIYFSINTCKKIDELQTEFFAIFYDYSFNERYNIPFTRERYEELQKLSERTRNEVQEILNNIGTDFRSLLGVQD